MRALVILILLVSCLVGKPFPLIGNIALLQSPTTSKDIRIPNLAKENQVVLGRRESIIVNGQTTALRRSNILLARLLPRKVAKPLVRVVNNHCCIPELQSRRLPEIVYEYAGSVFFMCQLFNPNKFTAYIRAELLLGGVLSDGIGLAGEAQRPNNQAGPSETEYRRKPRREYLFFGGIRSPYLGVRSRPSRCFPSASLRSSAPVCSALSTTMVARGFGLPLPA